MAGIFKSLDRADIRITPFRSYKLWPDTIVSSSSGISGSVYTVYKANYNPETNFNHDDILRDTFDQGNIHFTRTEPTTSNGEYQRVVHKSINHLYYRDFYTNNKASFGSGNINKQNRFLEDQAWIISMPQSRFGESILPGSISILITGSFGVNSGSLYTSSVTTCVTNSLTIIDDLFGNLIISGSSYYSPYGQYVGGAYTNYTSSITKNLAGEWPNDTLYQYVNAGSISFTSSFNKGMWQMESIYKNISVTNITGSTSPYASDLDLLGAVMSFTSSNSSSIEIKPNINLDYSKRYNFESGDFAISMMIRPTQKPTHPSGSILLNKQGIEENLKVDVNGNVYSLKAPNKTPYRLSYTTGSCKLKFERGNDLSPFVLTSSISMSLDTLYHVTAVKSGSIMFLYVNSSLTSSINSGSITATAKECSNLSNIFVGNNYTLDQGFNGLIDNLKIYKDPLSQNDINIMHHTLGVGNLVVGSAFYNHGMMTLTSIPTRFTDILTVQARGTHTILENEISCTVNAGDFGMSSNPTLEEYDYDSNQFVYKAFVTGSYFKPYVTTIGLYDNRNRLLIIGKLNTPIQTSNNTDTTFLIRYDK